MSRLAPLDLTVVMTKTTTHHTENDTRATDAVARHADAGGVTLVIGGTGKTGRKVAERLAAQGRPSGSDRAVASRPSTGTIPGPGFRRSKTSTGCT